MKTCDGCGKPMLPWHSRHYDGTGYYHETCRFGEDAPAQDVKLAVKRPWFFLRPIANATVHRYIEDDER